MEKTELEAALAIRQSSTSKIFPDASEPQNEQPNNLSAVSLIVCVFSLNLLLYAYFLGQLPCLCMLVLNTLMPSNFVVPGALVVLLFLSLFSNFFLVQKAQPSESFPEREEMELSLQKLDKDLKETRLERDKALQELTRLKQHLLEKVTSLVSPTHNAVHF